jgi:hypothetical protein
MVMSTDAIRKARRGRKLEKTVLACFVFLTSAGLEPVARANAIVNGNFTSTTGTFGTAGGGLNTLGDYTGGGSLSNWTIADVSGSTGLAFLYYAGNQGSTTTANVGVSQNGRFGAFSLYDPGNVAGATPTGGAIPNTSPGGGNFIVADGASGYSIALYQALTGLTAGATYNVSFWYAAGQQSGFTGTTTEGWQVSLENTAQTTQVAANGTTIQDTPAQAGGGLASGAFQAWAQETFSFTASSSSQVLTFLSLGTPSGQPPAVLLSDVVMTVQPTPEPASLGMCGMGLTALIALLAFGKKQGFGKKQVCEAAIASQHG